VHEIKHDGYRLIARRTGDRVRLYTRRGYNWADRYPRIVDALLSLRAHSITIDGEAVICAKDGRSDFDRLHSRGYDAHVLLYGFDLIELNGEDLRTMPLEQRKGKLEKLLAHTDGIRFSEHLEGDGASIFLPMPASSGLRASYRSGATFPTARDGARPGLSGKTRRIHPCCGSRTGHRELSRRVRCWRKLT
jgi:ATP-dependent DNA ligase